MDIETTMTNETKQRDASARIIRQAGLGVRLKTARESMRISEKDAATRLHLNPRIISIMENEEFENGPPETFMRGYIRSYARLLSIPDSEICAALTQIQPPFPIMQPAAPSVMKARRTYHSHRYLRSMTYLVVAILAVLVSVWWTSHSKDSVQNAKPAVVITVPAPVLQNTIQAAPVTIQTNTKPAPATQNNAPSTRAVITQPITITPPATPIAPEAAAVVPVNPAVPAPASTTPATQAPAATKANPAGNLDKMDMSLSDPLLDQGENSDTNNASNVDSASDTKYNNTN